ncbi:MAG: MMPL family transporter, partial [Armatimonadaceae bacterium]
MKNTTFSGVESLFSFLIKNRKAVVLIVAVLTVLMGFLATKIEVKTIFSDLLPKNHPYVAVNQKYKSTFGGSNLVTIMVEVDKGDIFNEKVLSKVQKMTVGLQQVNGIDTFQIISIASKKLKEVRASTEGVETRPIMWPDLPQGEDGMAKLRTAVLNNALIYGPYVSMDLKATLITADFRDGEIDYSKAFNEIMGLVKDASEEGIKIRVVGEPVLYGWVNYYLDETIQIFFAAIASLVIILLLITRTWHGTLLPLLAGSISAVWALGAADVMGFHLDPLVIVVAFLITAQAISNSVQLISRYDDEIVNGAKTSAAAAIASAQNLFKPSMLAIVA